MAEGSDDAVNSRSPVVCSTNCISWQGGRLPNCNTDITQLLRPPTKQPAQPAPQPITRPPNPTASSPMAPLQTTRSRTMKLEMLRKQWRMCSSSPSSCHTRPDRPR